MGEGEIGVNRRSLLAAMLALCLLTGCGGSAGDPAPAGAEASGGAMTASRLENQAAPLTEEDVLSAYSRAEEAYGWFDRETLPAGQESREIDGRVYYPVREPGMETLADLRAYLRGLFSEELTEALLSSGGEAPLYRDVGGALYVLPARRDRDAVRKEGSVRAESVSETAWTVEVTVDLLDGPGGQVTGVEYYAFPYELEEDRWVFTEFRMID